MDLVSMLRVLRRRWIVVVAMAAVTVAATVAVLDSAPKGYRATGEVLLLLPSTTRNGAGTTTTINPYLQLGGSLSAAGDVVARALESSESARALRDQGALGQWEIQLAPGSPVLHVEGIGPTPAEASRTVQVVMAAIEDTLEQRQLDAGAPAHQLIQVQVVSAPDRAVRVLSTTLRPVVAVVAAGMLVTLGTAYLVEALAGFRRPRRQQAHPATTPGSGDTRIARAGPGRGRSGGGGDRTEDVPLHPAVGG